MRAPPHRRAHHSVLSAVCVDLARSEPHSRQSSLAGRAGFRNGGGWRGGHGGEHHPASEPAAASTLSGPPKTTAEMIREACHEVQRPVFYAIAIIITAYLPIFTLQRVEGRLFRPMAWTVAFALLGAMTFSILIAPVLAATFFRKGVRERRNLVMDFLDGAVPPAAALGRSASLVCRLRRDCFPGGNVYLGFGGVIGAEFLPHLDEGAIWARGTLANSTSLSEARNSPPTAAMFSRRFPEVKQSCRRWPARRRNRHRGIRQHRVFRRLEAARPMAPGISQEQRGTDRRHEPRAGKIPGARSGTSRSRLKTTSEKR
jgi:multidrug efflux pump subunit AcrB